VVAVAALLGFVAPGRAGANGFVGDGKCANPTCHGAALPRTEVEKKEWRPWKSARTQWLNRNIDRHSRAYATLETAEGKTIARYMGIEATTSEKCLICHAPTAPAAAGSLYRRGDGVTCEHCHGAAEAWLKPHVERDWRQKQAEYGRLGFTDLNDFRVRAEKCASCHVDIDHEIVAGGHPPLQFEMVAYAQVMKHWDDQDERPPGAFSADPTLWALGQLVGLRTTADMIARRAGAQNYQALGKFEHFKDRNCYQCHHKLVADAVRQATGHYRMAELIFAVKFPQARGELGSRWSALSAAAGSDAAATLEKAAALSGWIGGFEQQVARDGVDKEEARRFLSALTAAAATLKPIERFTWARRPGSNVLRIDGIELPWWYTTGAPEQAILAVEALCPPAYPDRCTGGAGFGVIDAEIRQLLEATDRANYQPDKFAAALGAIQRKLK